MFKISMKRNLFIKPIDDGYLISDQPTKNVIHSHAMFNNQTLIFIKNKQLVCKEKSKWHNE